MTARHDQLIAHLLAEIRELLEREQPRAPWDTDQGMRQSETLYTWTRERLEAGVPAATIGAVLARLAETGYTDVVNVSPEIRRICDARARNRGRVADLRRLVEEYRKTPRRLSETDDPGRLDRVLAALYEHPGESYRALLTEREDPVLRELLARLPRHVRK